MDRIFWDEPAVSEAASTAPLDKEDSFRMSQMKSQRSGGYSQAQQEGYSQGQQGGYSQGQQRGYYQGQQV
jgi:flagellar biosynthesis/type III secretory pathway protein FliH